MRDRTANGEPGQVLQLDALAAELGLHGGEPSNVATRLIQALDESGLQWRTRHHHNWDGLRGCHSGSHRRGKMGDDHSDVAFSKLGGKLSGEIASPLSVADVKRDIASFRVA